MHYRHKFRILLFVFVILFVIFVKFTCYGQHGFLSWNEYCSECKCNTFFNYDCKDFPSTIGGCGTVQENFCGISTYGDCQTQNDCVTDGCSGQICRSIIDPVDNPISTTCEYRDCYDRTKFIDIVCYCEDNKCQWAGLG